MGTAKTTLLVRALASLTLEKGVRASFVEWGVLLEETYVARDQGGQKQICASFGGRPEEGEAAQELAGLLSSPPRVRARYRSVGGLAREGLRRYGAKKLEEALFAYQTIRSSLPG